MVEQQLRPKSRAKVLTGRLKGTQVRVIAQSASLPGFWDCVYHRDAGNGHRRHEVVLTSGQLEVLSEQEDSHD